MSLLMVFIVVVAGALSLGLFHLQEKQTKNSKNPKDVEASLQKECFAKECSAQTEAMSLGSALFGKPDLPGENDLPLQSMQGLIDYDVYLMSKKEWFFYFSLGAVFLFFVAYVFYQSIVLSALVAPLAFFYPRIKAKEIIVQRKKELALQFKEALYALSSSLMAGRSLESAFKEALKDLYLLYPNSQTYIIQEFTYISRRIDMNVTIEDALVDFAQRAHLEDIDSFVDVLLISKRTGGNIVEIIKNTSTIIGDKLQIKQEIDTLLAEKKFEQKILNVMPIVMILLLTWSTGDYMGPVFTTFFGKLIMTIAVLLLGLAYYLSKKIMTIEV